MTGEWYSAMSTGVLEIDCQHQNLDAVLSVAMISDDGRSQELLQTFALALSDHFSFEEAYTLPSGSPFVDSRHESEHRTLEGAVSEALLKMGDTGDSANSLALKFARLLVNHATDFDIPAAKQ